MVGYGYLSLSGQTSLLPLFTLLTVVLLFSASLAHLLETRGVGRTALMLGSAFGISLGCELLGVATGWMFGNYTYTDRLGAKVLGLVPLVIPIAWLMMLYPAYETAALLADRLAARLPLPYWYARTAHAVLHIILAALAMTAWDLSLDPRMVNEGNWVWHDGGAYFGIPLSNFLGWLITALLIYAVWRTVDARGKPDRRASREPDRSLHTCLPVLAYLITWLAESSANVLVWGTPLVGAAVFVGMGLFGIPALACIWPAHVSAHVTTHIGRLNTAQQSARRWLGTLLFGADETAT
jgi:putative membrane protein